MAIFSTIGSIISSGAQRSAANTARDTALDVANQNNALARDIYGQNRTNLTPFMQNGSAAGTNLNAMLGLGTAAQQGEAQNDFRSYIRNSDYGFQFGEGANQVNSGYAGSGVVRSGAAMRGLEDYRQNLQSGYRGEYMNALGNQQGVGLAGASALAGVGQNYVNNISANNNSAGSAAANAALIRGANNPFANALGTYGGAMQNLAGTFLRAGAGGF